MTDDELIKAIISFEGEITKDAVGSQLNDLGGKLEKLPACTTLENIEATENNTKLKVTTSAGAYTFDFSGRAPVLIDGLNNVNTSSTKKYTADLCFSDYITVDKQEQKSVVLTWPAGRAIDGKNAEDKYNKYKPSEYSDGRTKYKFSPAGVSISGTGISGSVTGASVGLTGAEFSVCMLEDVFRVLGMMAVGIGMGCTATKVELASVRSKLLTMAKFLFPVGAFIDACQSKLDVVKVKT